MPRSMTLCRSKRALAMPPPLAFSSFVHCFCPAFHIMAVPANSTFPSGGTWFDTLHKSFVNVSIDANNDNAIPTSDFLEAAESLTTLFGRSRSPSGSLYRRGLPSIDIWTDVLGSMAFTPVKNDMVGNIKVSRLPFLLRPSELDSATD